MRGDWGTFEIIWMCSERLSVRKPKRTCLPFAWMFLRDILGSHNFQHASKLRIFIFKSKWPFPCLACIGIRCWHSNICWQSALGGWVGFTAPRHFYMLSSLPCIKLGAKGNLVFFLNVFTWCKIEPMTKSCHLNVRWVDSHCSLGLFQIVKVAKRLKKEKVNVDVVNFGEEVNCVDALVFLRFFFLIRKFRWKMKNALGEKEEATIRTRQH